MKKINSIFFVVFFLLITGMAYGESKDIPCVKGNCAGWKIWYENESGITDNMTIHIKNETGITAFGVVAGINSYDQFGKLLERTEIRDRGPFYNGYELKKIVIFPSGSWKIQCDMYWTNSPD